MSKTAVVTTRIEPELKSEVEAILSELGLTTSQAILLYFKQIKRQRAIPFSLEVSTPVAYKVEQNEHILAESGAAYLLSIAGMFDSGHKNTSENVKSLLAEFILEKYGKTVASISPLPKKQSHGKQLLGLAGIASLDEPDISERVNEVVGGYVGQKYGIDNR